MEARTVVCCLWFLLPYLASGLTLWEPGTPTITTAPKLQKVLAKGRAVFICKVQGNPTPSIYWKQDKKGVNSRRYRHLITEGPSVSVLIIDPVRFGRDDGAYTCVAENGIGEARETAQLTVYKNMKDVKRRYPKITAGPKRTTVNEGGKAILTCEKSGTPEPKILWLKDNIPVDMEDTRIKLSNSGTLTIRNTTEYDMGWYQCLAENEVGLTTSSAAMLNIQGLSSHPSMASITPQHQAVAENEKVSFICTTNSSHPSSFRWETGSGNRVSPRWNRYLITNSPHMSVLSIDPVKPKKDARQFVCISTTVNTVHQSTANLSIYNTDSDIPEGYPEIVANPSDVTMTEIDTAFLQCEATGTPKPTIQWLKNQFPVNMTDTRISILESGYLQIKNSRDSDTGRYECLARNDVGVAYSKSAMLFIKVYPGRPAITQAPQDKIVKQGDAVTFSCEANGNPTPSFTWVRNYELVDVSLYHVNGNRSTLTIDAVQLQDNNTYVTCTAANKWGEAWNDAWIRIGTISMTLQALAVSANEIDVTWTVTEGSLIDMSYILYYNDTYLQKQATIEFVQTESKYRLRDMTPDTLHHIQLCIMYKDEELTSQSAQATTLPFIPGEPREVKVERVNSTTLVVKWRPPSDTDQTGIIRGYEVYVYEVDGRNEPTPSKQPQLYDTFDSRIHDVIISGLSSKKYIVRVGAYTVKGGGVRSRPKIIPIFPERPKIIEPPDDILANEGDTVELKCKVAGDLEPTWKKQDGNIPHGRARQLKDGTLQIEEVQSEDDGLYMCVAANLAGSTEAAGRLTVNSHPSFLMKPRDKLVGLGRTVSLQCVATGKPAPTVFWQRRNTQMMLFPNQGHENGRFSVAEDGTLRIERIRFDDEGEYECQTLNTVGTAKVTARIEVRKHDSRPPPIIEIGPQNQTLPPGELVMLPCQSTGDPQPMIRWYRNEQPVLGTSARLVILHSGTLRISDVRVSDSDIYICKAVSETGETTASAHLNVTDQGPYHRTPQTLLGRPLKPVATKISDTSVHLTWKTNSKKGDSQNYAFIVEYFSNETQEGWIVATDSVTDESYTIQHLLPETNYVFLVRAKNSHEISLPSEISDPVRTSAPGRSPWNVRARAVTSTSIIVSWNKPVNPSGNIQGYKVFYTLQPEKPIFFWDVQDVSNDNELTIISGLEPNQTYTISALAYSGIGQGPMSHPIQVLTTHRVPSPPRNLYVVLIQEDPPRIKATWQRPRETNGPIENYKIIWGRPGQRYEEIILHSEKYSFMTHSLDKGAVYEFRVSAKNDVNYGESSVQNIKTPDGIPTGAPQNFIAMDISETSLRLTWDLPARTLRNGDIVMYQITYHKLSDPINEESINVTDMNVDILGLEMNTDYRFKIKAYTSKGSGPWSQNLNLRTYGHSTTPGSPPRNVRARAASSTTIIVSWNEPEIPNGIIQGYKVFYTLQPEKPIFFWDVQDVTNDNKLTTISGLEPNQTYTISVLAYSGIGQGPMSHPIQVLTRQGAASIFDVLNLHADPISANEIEVMWDAPHDGNFIEGYELYYNDSHFRQNIRISIRPPVEKYTLTDLTPDTVYHIQVSAKSTRGEGPKTPTIQAKTKPFIPGEPRKVRVETINSTAIFVEWRPPIESERNGIIRGYQVYYYEVDSNDESIPGKQARFTDTFDGTKHESVITGLDPDTRYNVRVAAYTRKGDGIRSKARVITTKGAVPSPPRNLHIVLIHEDPPRIKATWQRPRVTHGLIENYKLIWGRRGQRYEEIILQSEKYSFMTHLLDKGTVYEFRVSAKNDVDYGESSVQHIKTPDGIPTGAPQNFIAMDISETSLRLTWDLPARALRNGDIVMYQISYHKLSDPINEESINVTDMNVNILGLEMNTDYRFKIKAYTSKGSGPWSQNLNLRTYGHITLIGAPRNVQTRRRSDTIAEVTWDEPDSPVAGYKIYYSMFATPVMDTWQTLETGPYTKAEITGLEPHTVYAVRVQARSVDGRYGNLSDVVILDGIFRAPGSPPRNVRARAASSTTIIVSWNEPEIPNGIIQGYKVFYTLYPEKPIFFWDVQDVTNDNKLTTISGLEPNQTYTIGVLAYSGIGQGPMSHPIQVLTRQGVPYQPLNLHADPISANEIEVTWDAPQEADFIESYELYYNDSHFRQNIRISIKPPVEKYTLTDLTPDTVYHIQVSVKSTRGEGPKTPTIQAKTKPFMPYQPLNLHADPISANEIEVTWDAPQEADFIESYELYYNDSHFRQNIRISIKPPVEKYTLTDLTPDTVYHIQVSVKSTRGEGPKTPTIQAKTKPFIPGEPRKVRVETINSTAIFVEWRPPIESERNGIIRGYQVYYYEVDSNDESIPGKQARFTDTFDGTKHESVIAGLDPDTRYNVRVAAYTRKGDGIRSKARVITTKGAVPSPPRNLYVDLIQDDPRKIKVTWQRPRETYGLIENYKIIWGRPGERYEEIILQSEKYSFVTHLLDKGTVYEFRVSAKNDVDYGESSVQNIKTPEGIPTGAPQNFTVDIKERSLRLTWDLPARTLRNGDIVMYQITYHKLSNPINQEDINVTDTYVDILGLEENTGYRFKIKAYTSKGSGPWSRYLYLRTYGHMIGAPRNVQTRRRSDTIAEVTWDEPDSPVASYKIYYSMFATPVMDTWKTRETGPYTKAEITGLEPHTVYAVRVQARSVDGRYGNLSDVVILDGIFHGHRDVVKDFRVDFRTSDVLKFTWDKPEKSGVEFYVLKYKGVKTFLENGIIQQIYHHKEEVAIPHQTTTWSLSNLLPYMKYSVNISAIYQDNSVGEVNHITVQTRIEAPTSVKRPEVVRNSQGRITLRLFPASTRNGPIGYYDVVVVPQRRGVRFNNTLPQDFSLEMLKTGDLYHPYPLPYIAARFKAGSVPQEFDLGDSQEYRGFINRILDTDMQYKVFLRAYSVDPRLYTSSDYSELLSVSG